MRGAMVLIFLLLGVAFIVVVSESEIVAEDNTPTVVWGDVGSGGKPANSLAAFVPVVDRGDDPAELLPCTEQPNDCSLRSALQMAHTQAKPANVTFADHFMIKLSRPLPPITQSGITIVARPDQELHVDGNGLAAPVFHITAENVRLEGLRIYGAGAGYANVLVNGPAQQAIIAHNLIGDDDAPEGNCGQTGLAANGIYVQSDTQVSQGALAWIYGNIVECNSGDGLVIRATSVTVGQDAQGNDTAAQRNVIRHNGGTAVRLDNFSGNTICNNLIHNNLTGALAMTNFDNNLMDNEIRQ